MGYEHKPNTGTLFPNDKKSSNQPDYTGTFKDATGKEWRLAAWSKPGKKGNFLSVMASEPQQHTPKDDLPFLI